ncbi:hypothetical protein AUJ77_03785 [Candidatus Nomurabacteria bacterium CG1_02_43_90]|uniref:RNA polymerase sigma-70 region 2 domain-containing protein n=1 Tax=Candidatus Nomurabacteria bacterium CG1_02_43_90 TaxID=1805281 RepID=A0A1J4V2M6_9BACT|nr:MAG: hypothetical protein AUJ77_03785 [Candidatus Nomurabacteria bacterium CG1_02_43_90]
MTAPPNLENEKDLLISIIAGNMDSFETMLHYYEKPIWNHLRRITGNNDNASDLLQETFLKVYRNRKRIAPENNFKNWVYRIATNTAYDFLRKKRHIIEISLYANEGSETILPELAYLELKKKYLLTIWKRLSSRFLFTIEQFFSYITERGSLMRKLRSF